MVGKRPAGDQTVLAYPLTDRLVIVVGIPALAVLVGAGLPVLARWALSLPGGLPMGFVFRFIGAADTPLEVGINLAIWLLVGLAIAGAAWTESAKLTLTDTELSLDVEGGTRTIARSDVDAVFLDGKYLVVLDSESRLLARESHQASDAAVARAFRAHGYPWRDADPYADLYRKWEPDTPDLPSEVNAVLAARQTALSKKAGREVRDLREVVQRLGFTVRDEGGKQYWRPLVRS